MFFQEIRKYHKSPFRDLWHFCQPLPKSVFKDLLTSIWQAFIASSARSWPLRASPAQQRESTMIGTSAKCFLQHGLKSHRYSAKPYQCNICQRSRFIKFFRTFPGFASAGLSMHLDSEVCDLLPDSSRR